MDVLDTLQGLVTFKQQIIFTLNLVLIRLCGPGSSVGIATDYGLDGPGIESRWRRDFPACPDRPWGTPSLLYKGTGSFWG